MNFSAVIIIPLYLFFGNREIKQGLFIFIREQHLRDMVSPGGKPAIKVAGHDVRSRQFEQERSSTVSFQTFEYLRQGIFSEKHSATWKDKLHCPGATAFPSLAKGRLGDSRTHNC